ncbi:S41 family peptidase, partial [Bacillus sp. SIMBA_161]
GVDADLGLTARRAHIVPETVTYHRAGDAAYIKVSGFNQDTANSVERTLDHAKNEIGPSLTGFILDLRNNPGGLLDQAVDVSDIFVTEGRIVST